MTLAPRHADARVHVVDLRSAQRYLFVVISIPNADLLKTTTHTHTQTRIKKQTTTAVFGVFRTTGGVMAQNLYKNEQQGGRYATQSPHLKANTCLAHDTTRTEKKKMVPQHLYPHIHTYPHFLDMCA